MKRGTETGFFPHSQFIEKIFVCTWRMDLIQSALEKLRKKKLDLIVANDISAPGIGFQSDNNQVSLIDSSERIENLPRMTKKEIANILLDKIKQLQP